jgi:hypothetical protein
MWYSHLLLVLSFLTTTYAWYDQFLFATNSYGNASCPDLGFNCAGPDNVCAHDAVLGK